MTSQLSRLRFGAMFSPRSKAGFFAFVGNLFREIPRRETAASSHPQHRSATLARPMARVSPRPAAQLASSTKLSDNGGIYGRRGETVIFNSDSAEKRIRAKPKKVKPRQFGLATIENAIVCGEGIIWKRTPAGNYAVAETLREARSSRSLVPLIRGESNILFVRDDMRPAVTADHTYVFLRQVADNNYGHWITEVLPKVAIVADHYNIKDLKFIVTRHLMGRQSWPMRQVYLDSLAAFGIEPHQIVPMGRRATEIKHLIYPLPVATHPNVKAPRTAEILEGIRDRLACGEKGPRRLYVSRAHAKTRRLRNEAQILKILRDHDFAVVHPERLSFAEQVRLFANAELVAGNCGANLTNAVFAPRGVKIFALVSEVMSNDFFWDLANLKSGKYFAMHGKAIAQKPTMNSDFTIDPVQFRSILENSVLS